MYYLERKQFKPAMMLFGIPMIPCIIGLIISMILQFETKDLICLLVIIGIYLIIAVIFWMLSNRKRYYLSLKDDIMELKFCDVFNGETRLELKFDEIIKFEYYRINSIRGWLMLYSFILPKCVFLTYNENGESQTKFIGYLDLKDVKYLSKITNSELKIY